MSIVVAAKDGNKVTIASDRAISYKTNVHFGGPKYFGHKHYVVGVVGCTRYHACVKDFFNDFDSSTLEDSDIGTIYKHIAMPLRELLKSEGQVFVEGDIEYCQGELILICDNIYLIDSNFGVGFNESNLVCLGSAEQVVKGFLEGVGFSLLLLENRKQLLTAAIKAACKYDTCCDGLVIDEFELVEQ